MSLVGNTRRLSDLFFTIDRDLNVTKGNRSFLIFLQKTEFTGVNLDSILYEYSARNLRFFLKNFSDSDSVNPRPFVCKIKLSEDFVTCILTITKVDDNTFDISVEELNYSRQILDDALLESREYAALLQNFDAYYFIYEDKTFYVKNTKDLNTVFKGTPDDFKAFFPSLFKLNLSSGDCEKQLDSMIEEIQDFKGGKYFNFLRTDKKRLCVHVIKTSTRKKSIMVGSVNFSNKTQLEENTYAESHDGLTGLYNKVAITEMAIHKINKEKTPCTLIIIDVDNFKECNDTYGHAFGDKVLVFVSNCIKESVGTKGIAGRIGGDEFLVLIDSTDEADIRNVTRNIRVGIQWNMTSFEPNTVVTCSMGAARFPSNAKNYSSLFKLADKCLYIAKYRGRNCYVIYKPELHDQMIVENRKNMQNVLSGQTYSESAEKEFEILEALKKNQTAESLRQILTMLLEYLKLSKITIYDSKFNLSFIAGKDEFDFRAKALKDRKYFKYFNKFGFFHMDNTNVLSSVNQEHYEIYRDNEIATTLEAFCCDEHGNKKGLICYDIYRPARTFPQEKITFMLVVAKILGQFFDLENS